MFRSKARSVCPNLVANVTGVSPSAFLADVEAPQSTKNFANSSFGVCPQHRCSAVSPFAFLTSKSVSFMPLRNLINYILLVLAAWCKRELSKLAASLKLRISAPCSSIFYSRSKSPFSAACFAMASEPFICSRWSIISALATGSWQYGHFWIFLTQ